MAGNHLSTRPTIARKPHRYQVDEGLGSRFFRHANSAHVLQTLWRGLYRGLGCLVVASIHELPRSDVLGNLAPLNRRKRACVYLPNILFTGTRRDVVVAPGGAHRISILIL
jgi:hypothetical protein